MKRRGETRLASHINNQSQMYIYYFEKQFKYFKHFSQLNISYLLYERVDTKEQGETGESVGVFTDGERLITPTAPAGCVLL